jgi:hypothetical protein
MNPEQLRALFAQHKTAALGVAGAGVVGLALLQRKKRTTGGPAGVAGRHHPGRSRGALLLGSGRVPGHVRGGGLQLPV